MKAKTKLFILIFTSLTFILLLEVIYLTNFTVLTQSQIENKKYVASLLSLPNIAISSDKLFLRHRSYASISDILPNDGELQSNSKMSFVY
jgi:hypothetical protein